MRSLWAVSLTRMMCGWSGQTDMVQGSPGTAISTIENRLSTAHCVPARDVHIWQR
jgi:hypothetical protein